MISSGKATLRECSEYYSAEDVYLMLEVVSIDAHNKHAVHKFYKNNPQAQ